MSDEGVGVRVVQQLLREGGLPPEVEALDLGTGGLRALHLMAGRGKAVFVDCARMGASPGEIRRFTPENARSAAIRPRLSVHECDLFQVVELSRQLGECPDEVVFFGIEPEVIAPGETLSPTLAARLAGHVGMVRAEALGRGG